MASYSAKKRPEGVMVWAGLAVLAALVITPHVTAQYQYRADLQGNYCRYRRPSECCDGRYDPCSVPLFDTLCYCDRFCNRTIHPDCCPDYWEVCLGVRPPLLQVCSKDGIYIPSGKSYTFNCNKCTCRDGQLDCEQDPCMVEEEVVQQVNGDQRRYGWTATNYTKFWGRKARDGLVLKTGTLNPETLSMRMFPILLQPDLSRIPTHFDARYKRGWEGRISGVRDQGWCGSSWAFSTLGITQDRLAIESLGNETVTLSPQHLISCDRRAQSGCKGGRVDRAWQYLRRFGVVNEECFPYVSGSSGQVPSCRFPRKGNLLNLRCVSDQTVYQRKDLYKTEPAYRISGKEEDIQWEIMHNGPVQAMIKVHKDLFMYQRGVYSYSGLTGRETASHSVRIVGWGEEPSYTQQPQKYWLVANSWGTDWGEQGYFRIKRGYNESDIETFVLAVRLRLNDYSRRARPGGRQGRHTQHHSPNHH